MTGDRPTLAGDPHIRPDLLRRLLGLRSLLERDGAVRGRADGRPRLRYRDGEQHRSIALRDDVEAGAVRGLIGSWRRELTARREEEVRPRREARKHAANLRHLKRLVVDAAGGGDRRRRRVAREFDAAAADPVHLEAYVTTAAYALPDPGPKSPGRGELA